MFAHEKLQVYRKALGFTSVADGFSADSDKKLAVVDQLSRACESLLLPGGQDLSCRLWRRIDEGATSIVLNIAEGNGRYSELDHRRFLDVAEGSAVKVAAYLDLAEQRRILCHADCCPAKELLGRIVAMLSRM